MSKNRYYLFARDKDTNLVRLIPLSNNDIFFDGNINQRTSLSLEEIDHMTMNFSSEDILKMHLVNTNRLDNYNSELFIVSRNGDNIKYLENVYKDQALSNELRMVTEEKLVSENDFGNRIIILSRFVFLLTTNKIFRDFIYTKYHNIYTKFIDYFKDSYNYNEAYEKIYSDSFWAKDSYILLRNIVEAKNRFFSLGEYTKKKAKEYVESRELQRNRSLGDIYRLTDKNYVDGQLSLFVDNPNDLSNEEKEKEKMEYLKSFIDELDYDSFVYDKLGVKFNKEKFNCTEEEYKQLDNLDHKFKNALYIYLKYNELFNDYKDYKEGISNFKSIIINTLENNEILRNRFYAFSLLYKKISSETYHIIGDKQVYRKKKKD